MSHPGPSPAVLYSFPAKADLVESLATFVVKKQSEAINRKGRFTIALSGGSLPDTLGGLIGQPSVKWDKWFVLMSLTTLHPHSPT